MNCLVHLLVHPPLVPFYKRVVSSPVGLVYSLVTVFVNVALGG
jgi:hypothetical protein